jgi:argininosuccinate synthase
VVLAFGGAAATAAAIPRLVDELGWDVVTLTLDLGQGGDLRAVRDQALVAGALRAHVLDRREALATSILGRALKARAFVDGFPAVSALAHPAIADATVTIAGVEHAPAVAHGGRGRSSARLTRLLRARAPGLEVVPIEPDEPAVTVCATTNLWGREVGLAAFAPAHRTQNDAGDEPPSTVAITYDRGLPVALNGVTMTLADLIESLATIARGHRLGRTDLLIAHPMEAPLRLVSDAPAAEVLLLAQAEIERMTLSVETRRHLRAVSAEYADIVDDGRWFDGLRPALDACLDAALMPASGEIRLMLHGGRIQVDGRHS